MPSLKTIYTKAGVPFTVASDHADRFQAFLDDPDWGDYAFDAKQSGGYNPRNIAGTSTPSQHSYGHAIDLNWSRNARGSAGDINPELARKLAQKHGLTWGGDWKNPDPMHFEVARNGQVVPVASRGITAYAGLGKPEASATPSPPTLSGTLTAPSTQPMTDQYTDEAAIKRRAAVADQMWGVRPSGGKYSALEGLFSGIGSGINNMGVRDELQRNQRLTQDAIRGAAGQPDARSLGQYLINSGVPPLAGQGIGVLSGSMEKEADRKAQLEQQKQLFEYQKTLQMDLKKQEQQHMIDQLRMLGVLPPAASATTAQSDANPMPGVVVDPKAAQAASPAAPASPPSPNDEFADELLRVDPEQKSMPAAQKAGVALVMGAKDKAVDFLTEKGEKLTEGQTKDASFAERMLRSEAGLREVVPIDKSGKFLKYDPTSSVFRFLPDWNVTNSAEWQAYSRNAREGVAAILRKDTGAAVSDKEWDWYFPMYYPQPGDSAQVVKDKQDARIAVARGLRASSGPAFDKMFPKFNEQLRAKLIAAGADLTPKTPPPSSGAPQKGASAQHTQVKRNPKTGEMVGYNPQTGQWEKIEAAPVETAAAPSLGEMATP